MAQKIPIDIAIVGGGIAGLWLLTRLRQAGYQTILIENNALGSGQTIASQGIIHGGMKYSLTGSLTNATRAISSMPIRWQKCLQGLGEINLSAAKILSNYHYIFSTASLETRVMSFFASKIMQSKASLITNQQTKPVIFNHPNFKGNLYQLNELVLDVESVVQELAQQNRQAIFAANPHIIQENHSYTLQLDNHLTIKPKFIILTAGNNNAKLLPSDDTSFPAMQQRPLHMVMVEHDYPCPMYAHCVAGSSVPKLTITSYPLNNIRYVWYLGGQIAEKGVEYSSQKVIQIAQQKLTQILPWVKLPNPKWSSLRINRAEASQHSILRPNTVFAKKVNNIIVAWPTKLSFAPLLSDNILDILKKQNSLRATNCSMPEQISSQLPYPTIATPPWKR